MASFCIGNVLDRRLFIKKQFQDSNLRKFLYRFQQKILKFFKSINGNEHYLFVILFQIHLFFTFTFVFRFLTFSLNCFFLFYFKPYLLLTKRVGHCLGCTNKKMTMRHFFSIKDNLIFFPLAYNNNKQWIHCLKM